LDVELAEDLRSGNLTFIATVYEFAEKPLLLFKTAERGFPLSEMPPFRGMLETFAILMARPNPGVET
jgi:hypothetical protein